MRLSWLGFQNAKVMLTTCSTQANGGIPRRMSPLLGLALLVLASKSFITSVRELSPIRESALTHPYNYQALVGALTPVNFLTEFQVQNLQFPEFSSASGTPDVECGYGETYGYGKNCPMNEAYGVIFDAGIQVRFAFMTETRPTRLNQVALVCRPSVATFRRPSLATASPIQ